MDTAKRVLITGAKGALGKQVVDRFLLGGYAVTGLDRPGGGATSDSRVEWVETDITSSTILRAALRGREFGNVVHCAGGFRYAKLEDTTDEDLEFLMNTNLKSTFYLLRELLPSMKSKNFGRIVLISSRSTLQPGAGTSAYGASKAGLNMIVGSLAEEVKEFNITVNAVLPTVIDTPANRKDMASADFSKWVKPAELAEIIFSLTQDQGRPIHGALLPVSGRL